jgi:hypothetical protein
MAAKRALPDEMGPISLRFLGLLTLATLTAAIAVADQARVEAPVQVTQGESFAVSWVGPNESSDVVRLTKAGESGFRFESEVSTRSGNPLTFVAPEMPGPYELRYVHGHTGRVLAFTWVAVAPMRARIQVPRQVASGAGVEVAWTGPDREGDIITIVDERSSAQARGSYAYTHKGSPARLVAPDSPGVFEVRYVSESNRGTILAAAPLLVGTPSAAIDGPADVIAGSRMAISWDGPDNASDYLIVVDGSSREDASFERVQTWRGNPLSLIAPDVPGVYEIRYVTGRTLQTLARHSFVVLPARASLAAPITIEADQVFETHWVGPDNENDAIAVVNPHAGGGVQSFTYTRRGNPVKIKAPDEPGTYEIRYLAGSSRLSLSSISIEVVEAPPAGSLRVVSEGAYSPGTGDFAVELVMDAAVARAAAGGGQALDSARQAIIDMIGDTLSAETSFALRVFGHDQEDICRTDLELPLGPLNRGRATETVRGIVAGPLAKTPLGRSLELVAEDLRSADGRGVVVLVVSSEESCEGNPMQAVRSLRRLAADIRLNIIGVGIEEFAQQEYLRQLALAGNGHYFKVSDAAGFGRALDEVLRTPFELIDEQGEVAATGLVDGDAVLVKPGTYAVNILSNPPLSFADVKVEPGKQAVLQAREQAEPAG